MPGTQHSPDPKIAERPTEEAIRRAIAGGYLGTPDKVLDQRRQSRHVSRGYCARKRLRLPLVAGERAGTRQAKGRELRWAQKQRSCNEYQTRWL
jgi:hypothetical protein